MMDFWSTLSAASIKMWSWPLASIFSEAGVGGAGGVWTYKVGVEVDSLEWSCSKQALS